MHAGITAGARSVHCGIRYGTYVVLRIDVVARLSHSALDCLDVARSHVFQKRVDAYLTHSLHNAKHTLTIKRLAP